MAPRRRLLVAVGVLAAVAVVAVAFFTTRSDQQRPMIGPGDESGTRSEALPPVLVASRAFSIRIGLEGETAGSGGFPLAPHLGLVATLSSDLGPVARGTELAQLNVAPDVVQAAQTSGNSITKSQEEALAAQTGPVLAPTAGIVAESEAGPVLRVPGVDVRVGLTPLQALRFRSARFAGIASVETVLGQRQVPCSALWLGTADAAGVSESSEGSVETLNCRLPAYAETVPGLRAALTISTAIVQDAVVVPNSALRYNSETDGYFIVVLRDGQPTSIPVRVGITDGVARIITSPIPPGAEIVFPDQDETEPTAGPTSVGPSPRVT